MAEKNVVVGPTSRKQSEVTFDAIFPTALQRQCVYIVSALAFVALLLAFAYSMVIMDITVLQWIAFIFGLASFLISALIIRSDGSVRTAAGFLITGGMVVTTVPAYYGAGVFSAVCIWFLFIPLMGGLLLGPRIAFIAGVLGVFSLAGLAYVGRYPSLPMVMKQDVVMHTFNLMLGVVFCSGITALVYKLMNRSALELIRSDYSASEKQVELSFSKEIFSTIINGSDDAIVMIDSAT